MISISEHTVGRLPHTHAQLARGAIGLLVGGAVAVLAWTVQSLLDAPIWVTGALGALALVGAAAAILAPGWFWIVEPYVRDGRDS